VVGKEGALAVHTLNYTCFALVLFGGPIKHTDVTRRAPPDVQQTRRDL